MNPCTHPILTLSLRRALTPAAIVAFAWWVSTLGFAAAVWTSETSLPAAVQEVSVTSLDGQVYVVGGSNSQSRVNTVYVFDPATLAWTARAPYPGTPRDHIGIAALGGLLYIVGGVSEWPAPSVDTVQRYDPVTDTWIAVAPLPTPRGAMAVAAINGKVYAAGGLVNGVAVTDFTAYDPATNQWQALAPMPTPRDHAVGVALNGKLYVTGGRTLDMCAPLTTVEVYDPVAGTWSTAAPMKEARGGHGAAAVNGQLYVFGGEGAPSTCHTIASTEVYDPASNSWSAAPPMPTPRHGTGGAVVGAKIYVPGGGVEAGDAPTDVVESLDTGAAQSLPSPWTNTDIGAVGLSGSATYSNGTFTVTGAGADIWGSEDSFHFAHQPLTGDGEITARITSLQNTHSNAKAGVMFRESLSPGSPHVILNLLPGGDVEFMSRASQGGSTTFLASQALLFPGWLRLVRTGNSFVSYTSLNGIDWTQLGSLTLAMPQTVHAGLAVTSHNAPILNKSTFDSVSVSAGPTSPPPTGALPAPWTSTDIGPVGVAGSASHATGVFTVKGAGADIWGTGDSFHFAHQPLTGDGQITARLTSTQATHHYAKAGVMFRAALTPGSPHVILDVLPDSSVEFMSRATADGETAFHAGQSLPLPGWLKLIRTGSSFASYTSPDGSTWTHLGTVTVGMPATAYVGIPVTSLDTSVLNTATFDNVTVTTDTTPPASTISFKVKALAVSGGTAGTAFGIPGFDGPTSLQYGPGGRLFVSTMNGKLYILTLDSNALAADDQMAVTSVQQLDDIYLKPSRTCNIGGDLFNCAYESMVGASRLVTGILIDPASTSTHVILYVTNSGLGEGMMDLSIDTYSGTLTRLVLTPDTATADPDDFQVIEHTDLVVGMPRSREVHAPNGMSIGPDGWMYIAVGGHTNAGQPSEFFGNLPEYYLSASVVRLNLAQITGASLPIDVSGVKTAADMAPLAGTFELYATGYRNAYDLTWHSNGNLYLNDNAGNDGQGNTPGVQDGCNTPSITAGDRPDDLNLVTKGAYGGHPNPTHGECVFDDGSIYSPPLAPHPSYVPPLLVYKDGASTNGIVEYTSDSFGGLMKGNLISATWGGNQNVRRVVLNAAGTAVLQEQNLAGFVLPLDVSTDADGNIYVAEHGANRISVMLPFALGTCPLPGSDPNVTDSDGDGYTDADEMANGTGVCNPASKPPDFDGDFVSDLLDPDDDNDGILDIHDQLFFDAQNGAATAIPLAFEYNPTSPAGGHVANTGFTGVQIASNGVRLSASSIKAGDAGGHLTLGTHAGTAAGSANSQVNALQIGFDSTSTFRVWTRIIQPFTTTPPAPGHVAGIFFGPDQDNFFRVAVIGTPGNGLAVEAALEIGGAFVVQGVADVSAAPVAQLDLFIIGNPAAQTLSAYFDLNMSGTPVPVAVDIAAPAGWFSNNAGAAANTSIAGIMTSHGAATPTAFGFDFFRIDRSAAPPGGQPPAAPGGPLPTSGATNVPAATALTWTVSQGATEYDVALGTSNPPAFVSTNQAQATYQPPAPLAQSTTYFWQVIAKNSDGATPGPVWSFTTQSSSSTGSSPFSGTPMALPGTLQAENFDHGGQGVAYHDSSPGNDGGEYRATDVDIEPTTDTGGGYNVGWMAPGEWLNYTVTVATAGTYTLEFRVAAAGSGGTLHLEVNGIDKTGPLIIPNTGGWQAWTTVTKSGVSLNAGQQVWKVVIDSPGPGGVVGNLNHITVTSAGGGSTPFSGTPVALPGTVQAENFDHGGQGVAYHDSSPGNDGGEYRATDVDIEPTTDTDGGYNVGWMAPGEWLNYTVTVATAGTYTLEFRVAAAGGGGTFHLEVNGIDKTGPLIIPNTGGWQAWTTVTKSGVSLNAGQQVWKVVIDSPGPGGVVGNLNHITVTSGGGSTPFSGTPVALPGTVQAENFDHGGQGVAYHDSSPGNDGGEYRATDVDIEPTTDTGGGYNVGWMAPGEWLNYTVTVATAGTYTLEFRVAAAGSGGTFHLEVNGIDKTGPLIIPNTGGWQAWTTVTKSGVSLNAGQQVWKVVIDSPGPGGVVGNINWIGVSSTAAVLFTGPDLEHLPTTLADSGIVLDARREDREWFDWSSRLLARFAARAVLRRDSRGVIGTSPG